jgi:cell division septation protein DedD
MAKHTVVPGDCFSSLAKANGFADYLTLYNDGGNGALKGSRPNPNQLAEGDAVEIPAKKPKEFSVSTGKVHKFVVGKTKTMLRLVLLDAVDKALKVKTCLLDVGGKKQATLPGGNGLVEMEVDAVATGGTLAVTWDAPPPPPAAPAPAPPPAASPPPYPAPIVAADFEDKPDPTVTNEPAATWTLQVGYMEPAAVVRGCLRRLANLGYGASDVQVEDAQTAAVVKAYQRKNGLGTKGSESGAIADVRSDLEKRHDKL